MIEVSVADVSGGVAEGPDLQLPSTLSELHLVGHGAEIGRHLMRERENAVVEDSVEEGESFEAAAAVRVEAAVAGEQAAVARVYAVDGAVFEGVKAGVVGGSTAVEGDKAAVGDKMKGGGIVAGEGEESMTADAEERGDGADAVDTADDLQEEGLTSSGLDHNWLLEQ